MTFQSVSSQLSDITQLNKNYKMDDMGRWPGACCQNTIRK